MIGLELATRILRNADVAGTVVEDRGRRNSLFTLARREATADHVEDVEDLCLGVSPHQQANSEVGILALIVRAGQVPGAHQFELGWNGLDRIGEPFSLEQPALARGWTLLQLASGGMTGQGCVLPLEFSLRKAGFP